MATYNSFNSNSEAGFIFASLLEFLHLWRSGKQGAFNIECRENTAFLSFNCSLGHPDSSHLVGKQKKRKRKSKVRAARDNARAAEHQSKQSAAISPALNPSNGPTAVQLPVRNSSQISPETIRQNEQQIFTPVAEFLPRSDRHHSEDAEDPDRKEIALSINYEDGSKNEDIESYEHEDADDYTDDQDDFEDSYENDDYEDESYGNENVDDYEDGKVEEDNYEDESYENEDGDDYEDGQDDIDDNYEEDDYEDESYENEDGDNNEDGRDSHEDDEEEHYDEDSDEDEHEDDDNNDSSRYTTYDKHIDMVKVRYRRLLNKKRRLKIRRGGEEKKKKLNSL